MVQRYRTKTNEKFYDWNELPISDMTGGLVLDIDSEAMENNQFQTLDSMVIHEKRLHRDTGYTEYLGAVRGNPRRQISQVLFDGTVHELLITDATVYRKVNDQWRYVSNGTSTTIAGANEAAGQTVLSVADITGFADNDYVGVVLDTGQMHFSQINGAPGGGTITIDDALPSQAAVGNAVVKAVALTGLATRHITYVSIPWNQWVVFTNGVDNVKRWDPTALTVIDLPGLVNTVCATLTLYDSSLILFNLTEGGTRRPYRVKYSAKGDATEWALLESGATDLLDVGHEIMQALILGPYVIIYRNKSIARMEISSSGLKRFEIETTVASVGIFSNFGAVDLVDKHIVWGNDDFYWYNGGFAVEPVGSPIKEFVFSKGGILSQIAGSRAECFALRVPRNDEILFFHRTVYSASVKNIATRYFLAPNKWATRMFHDTFSGFGEHILANELTWEDLEGGWIDQVNSWAGFERSDQIVIPTFLSAVSKKAQLYDYESNTDNGNAINAEIQTKDFSDLSCLITHDSLEIGFSGGTLTAEYSTDKGLTWNTLGVTTHADVVEKVRFFKQFEARVFRYRLTFSDPISIAFFNPHYKFDAEW